MRFYLRALAAALTLALCATLTVMTVSAQSGAELYVSLASSRVDPVELEGQRLSGPVAIYFTSPLNVVSVEFYLETAMGNITPLNTEYFDPFDFAGTNEDQSAKLFDMSTLSVGHHLLIAWVTAEEANGTLSQRTSKAAFIVDAAPQSVPIDPNGPAPTDPIELPSTTTVPATSVPATTVSKTTLPPTTVPPTTQPVQPSNEPPVVSPSGSSANLASMTSPSKLIYGVPWTSDRYNVVPIGGAWDERASVRFRANHTGPLASFQTYFIDQGWMGPRNCSGLTDAALSGYACGTGGKIEISIYNEHPTTHEPYGAALDTFVWEPKMVNGCMGGCTNTGTRIADLFGPKYFPHAPVVQQGQLYDIVLRNVDADMAHNYIALDMAGNRLVRRDPAADLEVLPLSEWALLYKNVGGHRGNNGAWSDAQPMIWTRANGDTTDEYWTPIAGINWIDGHSFGNGYYEFAGENNVKANGLGMGGRNYLSQQADRKFREVFVPKTDITINQMSARLGINNSGLLRLSIFQGDDTNLGNLKQITTATKSVTSFNDQFPVGFNYQQVKMDIAPVTLRAGTAYSFVTSVEQGLQADVIMMWDGFESGYFQGRGTTFDGYAQRCEAGTCRNIDASIPKLFDLQFFLRLA